MEKTLTGMARAEFADMRLEKNIAATAGKADKTAIFNNAAQVWNHTFYWNSLKPKGGGEPGSALKKIIETSFGSLDVWEHAYYLDYQNKREDYASAVLDKLINWGFAEENLC